MDDGAAWRFVAASAVGTSHRRSEIPCQDAFAVRALENGVLLVALADGAGSAENSDQGAQAAVEAAIASMAEWFQDGPPEDEVSSRCLICRAFESARAAVDSLAAAQEDPLRSFASTLTCAAVSDGWLAAGQLGDGAVIAGSEACDLFSVHRAQRGEYANETYFLTQDDALERVEFQFVERAVNYLAVMSDGLTRLALKMPAYEPYLPFFRPLFDFAAAAGEDAAGRLEQFLVSERVNARTDDDKSLVLAVRTPVSGPDC